MKTYIKSLLAIATVAFLGSSAWAATASFSGTLNLCKGDVFNYYENHGSTYTYTLKSNSDSTVAKGTGSSSQKAGKFFSIEALKAGKTTIVFSFGSSYTATMTVNVSDERVIAPGGTATVEGWGNSNEPGSSTWSSSNINPSGLVTVKINSQSTSAMKATLTAGSSANSGSVTIKNVSSNSGSEYVYKVAVKTVETKTSSVSYVVGSEAQTLIAPSQFTKSCTWSATSDKTEVATVSVNNSTTSTRTPSIKITPVAVGTATITVKNSSNTTGYNYTWTVTVTVTKATDSKTSSVSYVAGSGAQTLIAPSQFAQSCTWSATSDKTGVATVSVNNSTTSTRTPSIKITPVAAGTATITVKNSSSTTSYDYTWTVTVTVTKATDKWTFKDKTVKTTDAVKLSQTDNELVLAWKSDTGTLMLPDVAIADILVVGGGGGGGGAQRSSTGSSYWGDSGSGGAVDERMSVEIGAEGTETSFAIKIGAGGTSGTGGTSSKKGIDGGKGETSSLSGNGLTIQAEGGLGGPSRKNAGGSEEKKKSYSGTGSNYDSKITGKTYSVPGKTVTQAGQGSAQAATANTGNGGDAASDPNAEGVSKGGTGGSGYVVVRITDWKTAREPVAVPTAVTGLVYDYTEKTGVVAQTGYTLTGNTATNAGSYKATATLDKGYCWADDSSTTNKLIAWSIGYRPVTVTPVETNKLVGAADPKFTTTVEGTIADDPSVLTWTVWVGRTNTAQTVGFYDLLTSGEKRQGSYEITYEDLVNGFEIRAGKMTVNGKGYDNITDAFNDLLQNKGSATFNDTGIAYDGMTFQRGATLTVADDESWTVTNNGGTSLIATKIPGKMNLTVDGTFELSGDIFVAPMGEDDTIVTVTNFLLDASITVGKESNGATDAMAYLTFNTFANEDPANRITLTTNGVIRSSEQLVIKDVFTEVEHFHVAEKAIAGGFEYTLEATEFYVKYYDGDEVVYSNKFTILNYMTDLHIWNGVREGLELVGYTREDKVTPLDVSDAALRAYVKDEADKPGCDGEVKVFGTWEKPTITIKIVTGEGVDDVQTNGVSVVGDLELSAETTTVALELVKDGLTIPVYKVITNDVTNVTQRVATYAVVEGLTYTFIAEEAEDDDPTVTPTDTKKAILDAIDEENREIVAPKIDAVVDTAEPPAAGKVSAKEMATWITEKEIQSVDMKDSNYLAASVNLDTSVPITDAAEVKFVEVEEDTSTGFTFDFKLKLSGKEKPEELEVEAKKLAGYIQTTGDLGTDFEVIGNTKRVTIDPDTGKVTITPDPTKSAEFFKIVIPKDPGAK